MPKSLNLFFCKECGYETIKWLGQCPSCKAWNSMVEAPKESKKRPGGAGSMLPLKKAEVKKLEEIPLDKEDRISTGYGELNRVLGGGLVAGSLVLLGGDPGIGKSTIFLSVSLHLASKVGKRVLYVSGEESLKQIKLRANRMGEVEGELYFLSESNLNQLLEVVEEREIDFLVIDSIQTMFLEEVTASPGSVSQVRECTSFLLRLAKERGITIAVIGHVTKDGNVAGPKILEHMVDVVLYFEGEQNSQLRILHGQKNRFGSTNEIAVFTMEEKGLCEVENPSALLLAGRALDCSGSIVSCGLEGTRPILMEIQALLVATNFGLPRRTANGMDYNRLHMLLAVMERRLGIECSKFDAYINIAGGLRVAEPALDLAIVLALISSVKDRALDDSMVVFGEVGLAGEVRSVAMAEYRVREAEKLGFSRCILPKVCLDKLNYRGKMEIVGVRSIQDAINLL